MKGPPSWLLLVALVGNLLAAPSLWVQGNPLCMVTAFGAAICFFSLLERLTAVRTAEKDGDDAKPPA